MPDFAALARQPLVDDGKVGRVEICVMKHTVPEVEVECAKRVIENTNWPFRLTFYDNRLNPPNTAKMWNKFVREARCPYVCIMDSDAFAPEIDPCWLTRMMDVFKAKSDCDVVLAMADRCGNLQQRGEGPGEGIELITTPWSSFVFLFRWNLCQRFGIFDEDFLAYGPDTEFAVRLKLKGGKAYLRRDVWFKHVHGATHGKRPDREAERPFARDLFRAKKKALEEKYGN